MKKSEKKPWVITLLGVVIGLIILALSCLYFFRDFIPESTYTFLGERAFGTLSLDFSAEESEPAGMGAGGMLSSVIESRDQSDSMIWKTEAYEYIYDSTLPDLTSIDSTVYRRVNSFDFPDSVEKGLSQTMIGILPLSSFQDLEIKNMTLKESDDEGFNVYLDSTNGNISISRNDQYWLELANVREQSDLIVPSNDALVDAANRFLNDFRIDTSSYGSPTVDRSHLDLEEWTPETMSVVYPYLVNGTEVWSMWGQPTGMSVSINLLTGEADNLWTIGPGTLEASNYELTSDSQEVLDIAKRGGLWEYTPENPDATYTFTLGEPDVVLAEHYQYDDDGSSTLYVPALRFPVVEGDADAPYQQSWIIVPLVKDILEQSDAPVLYEEPAVLEESVETKY